MYNLGVITCHQRRRRPPPRAALLAIGLTLAGCAAALWFRAPLLARYWSARLAQAATDAERDAYLTALCRAGDAARWGIAALLADDDPLSRQYGVLVLHQLRAAWARERLLACLGDPDASVRRLAALGLAVHGDDAVVAELRRIYAEGGTDAAQTACVALEYLGTPTAVGTLNELAAQAGGAEQHAAVADALRGIGTPKCVPGLLSLLADERPCGRLAWRDEEARRAWVGLHRQGHPWAAATMPTSASAGQSVAERVAEALGEITGVRAAGWRTATAEARAATVRTWVAWYAGAESQP